MKKYAFVLHHNDLHTFLQELQKLGVVDVEHYNTQLDDEANGLFQQSERYMAAYKQLKLIKVEKDDKIVPSECSANQLLISYEGLVAEQEHLNNKAKRLEKEIQEALPWGIFDKDLLDKIAGLGLIPHFYVVYDKSYKSDWETKYPIQIIQKEKGKTYFVLLQHKGVTLDFDEQEIKFPSASYVELTYELEDVKKRLDEINLEIRQISLSKELLLAEKENIIAAFDFRVAALNAKRKAKGTIAIVSGYIPEPQNETLVQFLDNQGVYYLSEKAKGEENPPVLLKNNRFARLFEFITKMYSLPGYTELDLTPFFAPFFVLFFGLCFGDGGYGLLVFIVASLLKLKIKGSMRDILTLGQWFGLATVLVCMLTGSFFGITITPFNILGQGGLLEQKLNMPPNYVMLILSVMLGMVQVLLAMCLKAAKIIKQQGFKYALSQIAWIVLLVSLIVYFSIRQNLGVGIYVIYGLIVIAVLLIFFYNEPKKNIFVNFGLGIWNTYNMVSGLLGDLLSYVRLFALGFTGGVLGMVFNNLAFSIDVGFLPLNILATGFVLIVGHSLNFGLNGLGAFVHPLRLTFVEFYKNANFEGGGKEYKPFKINRK